jgi:hypothetical protein
MFPTANKSNVLLPQWILRQESILSEQDFIVIVKDYLTRYEGYRLIEVKNPFAVCDRPVNIHSEEKRRQGKGRNK